MCALTLPDFSHLDAQEAKRQFYSIILHLFDNWHLCDIDPNFEFSREWFDTAERMFDSLLHSPQIGHPRTGKPVKEEAAESQRRIAGAILRRVELAKASINSGEQSMANRYGAEIVHLIARQQSDADRVRGQNTARAVSEGGKAKGRENQRQRADWKHEAERIWLKRPNLSARAVARHIDETKVETIRKMIRRPSSG